MTQKRNFKRQKKIRRLLILGFISIFAATSATKAQTYDPTNVAVINALIANNGLNATPDDPETWDFAVWNNETPKQINGLYLVQKNLTGAISFEGLNSLKTLHCWGNNLTKIDLTNCTVLQTLDCWNNLISTLYISTCTQLEYLVCSENSLTELDVTNNMELLRLDCSHNYITELDVTNCTKMQFLELQFNNLAELDVTKLTDLLRLDCSSNNLTELDISKCTDLRLLRCGTNNLTALDVTNHTQLYHLECFYNKLTELDVTNCKLLQKMSCAYNSLTELDLSGLIYLNDFGGGYQNVHFTMEKNVSGDYTHAILLNNPVFGCNAISYSEGILKSTDNTITSTSFVVQTNIEVYELSGIMNFDYSGNSVFNEKAEQLLINVYPNPVKDKVFVECENYKLFTIKLYDMFGREVLMQTINGKTEININHLPQGIYNVCFLSEGKVTGNRKIVKQ